MTRLGRSSATVLYAEAQDWAEFFTIPGFRCGHPTHKSSYKSRLQFNTSYQAQISLPSTQRLPAGQKRAVGLVNVLQGVGKSWVKRCANAQPSSGQGSSFRLL